MKLVLFGATGMVGSRIATEASARGHQVLAVSRSGQSPVPGVTATAADAADPDRVAEVARGADAVASACVPPRDGSDPRDPFLALNEALGRVRKVLSFARRAGRAASGACSRRAGRKPSYWAYSGFRPVRREYVHGVARQTGLCGHDLVAGVRAAGAGRLMVVGGAGGLEVAPGRAISDQPGFPEAYLPEAHAHRAVLAYYRALDDDLDWTYVSPAAEIAPGTRTGRFRVGGDRLMTDEQGRSSISAEDYAVAFVDELEEHAHPRARMSVAY